LRGTLADGATSDLRENDEGNQAIDATKPAADLEAFIARWADGEGGQERANYALFFAELCDLLDVPHPDQASHDATTNAYAFERAVTFREPDGSTARGRIDLYKRGSFVLEAKQSRRPGGAKAIPEQGDLLAAEEVDATPRGRRIASHAWDTLMMSARRQKTMPRLCPRRKVGLANAPSSFSFSARIRVTSPIRSQTTPIRSACVKHSNESRDGRVIQSLNHTFKTVTPPPPGNLPRLPTALCNHMFLR
jgi:hypothetical protein